MFLTEIMEWFWQWLFLIDLDNSIFAQILLNNKLRVFVVAWLIKHVYAIMFINKGTYDLKS